MNRLKGRIRRIESSAGISLVEVDVGSDLFSSVVLEKPDNHPYLKEGRDILLLFKDTEVSIAKGSPSRISILNAARGRIRRIEAGIVLTRVEMDYGDHPVASVVATRSARTLGLSVGDDVLWLVKASEISLMEP